MPSPKLRQRRRSHENQSLEGAAKNTAGAIIGSCPGRTRLATSSTQSSTIAHCTTNRACHDCRSLHSGLLPQQRRCLCASSGQDARFGGSAGCDCSVSGRELFFFAEPQGNMFASWRCERVDNALVRKYGSRLLIRLRPQQTREKLIWSKTQ